MPEFRRRSPGSVRQALTESAIQADDKLARFVGLDAYHAAGGVSRADLFGDEVYLENPELLHQLAAEKLDGVRRELEAEGWKWVEVSPECDWNLLGGCIRIQPKPVDAPPEMIDRKASIEQELAEIEEYYDCASGDDDDEAALETTQQRYEALEEELAGIAEKLESLLAYDPQDIRSAGCYVSIGHDGKPSVKSGLVRHQDVRWLADDGNAQTPKPKGMPETLRRDLESYRLQAAKVEIARHRLVALDLLVFNAARYAVAARPVYDGPDVRFTQHCGTPAVNQEQTAARDALEAIREALPVAWLHQETDAEQFQAFVGLSDKDKLDLLAYCVATSLKPQLSTGQESSAFELALSLTDGNMAAYWRPTAANYLGRVTRDQLLAIGRDVLGDEWAQLRRGDKKGHLAAQLEQAFAVPEKHAETPEQREKLTRWLPDGMAFDTGAGQPASEAGHRKAA